MNATEARKVSDKNLPKLFEKSFSRVVSLIDNSIKEASKFGDYSIRQSITTHWQVQKQVNNRLVEHYENRGYKVETYASYGSATMLVSWGEEE